MFSPCCSFPNLANLEKSHRAWQEHWKQEMILYWFIRSRTPLNWKVSFVDKGHSGTRPSIHHEVQFMNSVQSSKLTMKLWPFTWFVLKNSTNLLFKEWSYSNCFDAVIYESTWETVFDESLQCCCSSLLTAGKVASVHMLLRNVEYQVDFQGVSWQRLWSIIRASILADEKKTVGQASVKLKNQIILRLLAFIFRLYYDQPMSWGVKEQ